MLTTEGLYAIFLSHPHIRTDTRKIKKGEIFFALKGPHFNGNNFARQALEKGASYAIIDEAAYQINDRTLLVPDVLKALQQLAAHHRNRFKIPILAITGSNGKTTTKELTQAVLHTTFRTYATAGNLNNHIGIPLTLLRIPKDTQIAIIEMGANHQKEIENYCKIVRPTHGLITNIGKAHLEGFGGIEGVKKGKGELFDALKTNGGTAFACADFPYFQEMTKGLTKIIWYGTRQKGIVSGKVIQKHPFLSVQLNNHQNIHTQLSGDYNLYNILAAAAVGNYFGVSEANIQSSIARYQPQNARSQVIKRGSNTFILDAYNANPTSMRAAISDFKERPDKKKYLFLGAMMELGADSLKEHQQLIHFIEKSAWEKVILVGGDFEKTKHSFTYFPTAEEAYNWFQKQDIKDAAFLIKGSRSIEMEKVIR